MQNLLKLSPACMVLDGEAGSAKLGLELSKPQLNHKSTQPNITLVGLDTKTTLHTTPPPTPHTNSILAISQLLLTRF